MRQLGHRWSSVQLCDASKSNNFERIADICERIASSIAVDPSSQRISFDWDACLGHSVEHYRFRWQLIEVHSNADNCSEYWTFRTLKLTITEDIWNSFYWKSSLCRTNFNFELIFVRWPIDIISLFRRVDLHNNFLSPKHKRDTNNTHTHRVWFRATDLTCLSAELKMSTAGHRSIRFNCGVLASTRNTQNGRRRARCPFSFHATLFAFEYVAHTHAHTWPQSAHTHRQFHEFLFDTHKLRIECGKWQVTGLCSYFRSSVGAGQQYNQKNYNKMNESPPFAVIHFHHLQFSSALCVLGRSSWPERRCRRRNVCDAKRRIYIRITAIWVHTHTHMHTAHTRIRDRLRTFIIVYVFFLLLFSSNRLQ